MHSVLPPGECEVLMMNTSCAVLPPSECRASSVEDTPSVVLPPGECDQQKRPAKPRVLPPGEQFGGFRSRGQLKVSISIEDSILTVHIHQARHLSCRSSTSCRAFVKISLLPDSASLFETRVWPNTTTPEFNERFSYELMPQDLHKRLMMSVMHKDSTKGCSELMGCMSFGIKNLLAKKKKVQGCFYLMSEQLGQRKHIPVRSTLDALRQAPASQPQRIPEMNKCLPLDQLTTVLLKKGCHGYGFTVRGSCPVRVGRVKQEGAASQEGLHRGDFIVRINGQNVSRSSAESIARLVKHAETQIELDIYCPHGSVPADVSDVTDLDEAILEGPDGASQTSIYDEENLPPQEMLSSPHSRCSLKNISDSVKDTSDYCQDQTVWNPDLSVISRVSADPLVNSLATSMEEEENSHDVTTRQMAIGALLECEQNFAQQMRDGIQRYSRPLRHCILDNKQHMVLFQNIEKLVAISEYHMSCLMEECADDSMLSEHMVVESVGEAYKSRVSMLCEAYKVYTEGFPSAVSLLQELRGTSHFQTYMSQMKGTSEEMSIEHFVQWPLQHLVDVCESLVEVLSCTSPDHHDYQSLAEVTQVLKKTCIHMHDHLSKVSKASRSHGNSSRSSAKSTPKVTPRSRVPFSSPAPVDPELLELQKRLLFVEGIESFNVAIPGKHVIYSGDLYTNCAQSRKLHVILLSDLLILTQQRGSHLVVVDEPIHLADVVAFDTESLHSAEFTLTARFEHTMKQVSLLCGTLQEKCTWSSLLQQRISSANTSCLSSTSILSIL